MMLIGIAFETYDALIGLTFVGINPSKISLNELSIPWEITFERFI